MGTIRPYQESFIVNIAQKLASCRSVVAQLPTGGGKTVCFAEICKRFVPKSEKDILILVHREELMNQSSTTLYDWHNIIAELITPKNKNPAPNRVYVGMVETVANRLKANPDYFRNVGLLIIDEGHLKNFSKILHHFENSKIIVFSATPIASNKKDPMKNYYQDIVTGPQISELISIGSLVPVLTYVPDNGIREKLHSGSGPDGFDSIEMASAYSNSRHVHNTVEKYKIHAEDMKALVFNCNVAHSLLVRQAFEDAGYQARHLDAEHCTKEERKEVLDWFRSITGAILCSVGILTTGFDEPTIECIIINKATKSLPLYLQMGGRGGRICPEIGKKFFVLIDMGNNALTHLEWSDDRDWNWHFWHPDIPKPKESGVAPIKICCNVMCEMIIPIQAVMCKYCGTMQPFREPTYDEKLGDFVLITKNINVAELVKENESKVRSNGTGYNDYAVIHRIKESVIGTLPKGKPTDSAAYIALDSFILKVREWYKLKGFTFYEDIRTRWAAAFFEHMKERNGWKPPVLDINFEMV